MLVIMQGVSRNEERGSKCWLMAPQALGMKGRNETDGHTLVRIVSGVLKVPTMCARVIYGIYSQKRRSPCFLQKQEEEDRPLFCTIEDAE